MSALWNPFSASTLTLRTALAPDACAERLGRRVKQAMEGAPLDQRPLAGWCTAQRFVVWWRSGFVADFMPIANGRFESDPMGTVVVVRIGMKVRGWVVVILWALFSVGFGALQVVRTLGDAQIPDAERAARATEALMPAMVMLGLLGFFVLLSAWIHRRDSDSIVETVTAALEAAPGPDFRPLT